MDSLLQSILNHSIHHEYYKQFFNNQQKAKEFIHWFDSYLQKEWDQCPKPQWEVVSLIPLSNSDVMLSHNGQTFVALKRILFKDGPYCIPLHAIYELVTLVKISKLKSKHLQQLLNFRFHDDFVDITTQYIPLSFSKLFSRSSFALEFMNMKIMELIHTVESLHSVGIAHRDIKNENICFDSNGHLVLLDFDCAVDNAQNRITLPMCTLTTRAPELLEMQLGKIPFSEYDGYACDWWSVICIVAEMFLCKPLFEDNNEVSLLQHIQQIRETQNIESLKRKLPIELVEKKMNVNKDALQWICQFLYPKDRKSLSWVCKHCYHMIPESVTIKDFYTIMIQRMKELFKRNKLKGTKVTSKESKESIRGTKITAKQMLDQILRCKNIVTGSFLLWCITGDTKWYPEDVDIYIRVSTSCTDSFVDKQEKNEVELHDFSYWLSNQTLYNESESYPDLPVQSRNYVIPQVKINMVLIPPIYIYNDQAWMDKYAHLFSKIQKRIKTNENEVKRGEKRQWEPSYYIVFDSVKDYIDKTCDMKFLHHYYDGILHVRYWNNVVERKSSLVSFRGVLTRSFGFSHCPKYFLHRLRDRIKKYETRHFSLSWESVQHQRYYEDHIKRCEGNAIDEMSDNDDDNENILSGTCYKPDSDLDN